MEFKEYEFRVNGSVSYDYFSDKPMNYNTDDYITLGFKLNRPVIRTKQRPKEVTLIQIENQAAKTLLNPQLNTQLNQNCNEKKTFIYFNGKKVCVVPTKLNVLPMKFSLQSQLTKCVGQPALAVNKEHCDQQTFTVNSPVPFNILKSPVRNVKRNQTVVKSEDSDNTNVNMAEDGRLCDSDTNSDSAGSSSVDEMENMEILTSRSANPSVRTYSRCPAKKNEEAAGNAKQMSGNNMIDYEQRVMTSMRTYKTRKSVSTSCEDLRSGVAVSTQTVETTVVKTVKTAESSTQTELDLDIDDDFLNSIITLDGSNGPIFSMGDPCLRANPATTRDLNSDKIMQQFYDDFKDCMNYNSKGNLPIHEGVLANDIKLVKRNCVVLKAKQEGVNILNHENLSPLQLAILNETKEEIIELLLSYGADLGAMDTEGNNVLHLAIENSRRKALEIMMKFAKKNKFDIDTFNYEGLSPLMLCCINGSHDLARLLLLNSAKPNLRDLKSGRTALFHASENHDLNMIKLLLKYKADTKIRNFFGTSPHDAMFEVDDIPECIKLLILGKDTHVRIQQKKRSSHASKFVSKKKAKYSSKTLNVVSTIQRIGNKVTIIKKSS